MLLSSIPARLDRDRRYFQLDGMFHRVHSTEKFVLWEDRILICTQNGPCQSIQRDLGFR